MSTVLQTKVRRPTKIIRDGEKVRLLPGDLFPYDPDNRSHRRALENGRIELAAVEIGEPEAPDVDAILETIRDVSGVGPALFARIEEAVRGNQG